MTRFQLTVMLDADDSVELDKLKRALTTMIHKSPKLKVVAIAGHETKAPGRPAEVRNEIMNYLPGRKPKSARQIARAIQRTDRSVYAPLHQLEEEGKVAKVRNNKYRMWQWYIPKPGEE